MGAACVVACGSGGSDATAPAATSGAFAGAAGTAAGGAGSAGNGSQGGAAATAGAAGKSTAGAAGFAGAAAGAAGKSSAGAAGAAGASGAVSGGGAGSAGTPAAGAAGASGMGAAGAAGAPVVDACVGKQPTCPSAPAGFSEGDGLAPQDRCAFPIDTASSWKTLAPLVDALGAKMPKKTVSDVLADTNRALVPVSSVPGGPTGVSVAFRWDDAENQKTTWVPQGITGSADAVDGLVAQKRALAVSFYFDTAAAPAGTDDKGVRMAFVDLTDPAAPTYRFALLVEPSGTAAAPDYKPISLHAGGVAWYQHWLYVADTGNGFRVFDTQRFFQAETDKDVIGCDAGVCRAGLYKYVLPQVGAYKEASSCSPRFSWVSLDRDPVLGPALVSGEYCSGAACASALSGRLFRWPLDPATGLLAPGRSWPASAFLMGQVQVQGGALHSGVAYLSSSAPAGGGGALYRVKPGKSAKSVWIDSPEDLMVDHANGLLFSLSEAVGQRYVFGAKLSAYPAP